MTDWLKDFEQRVEVALRYDEKVQLEPAQARELLDAAKRDRWFGEVTKQDPMIVLWYQGYRDAMDGKPDDKYPTEYSPHNVAWFNGYAVGKKDKETGDNLRALLEQAELVVSMIEKAEYVNGDSMDHEGARSVASHLLAELAEIKGK